MNSIITTVNTSTMSSLEIADLVDSRHDSVKRTIERCAEKGAISLPPMVEVKVQRERRYEIVSAYQLDKRSSLIVVAQLCPEFTARIVDRWQELEAGAAPSIPNFSNPADAARAWAIQYEARVLAETTKAQIGDKKVATAMNTASHAVKRANKLEIELDRSKDYASIKRMESLYGTPFNWRLLKSAAADIGIPSVDVFDANYGTVKAYHASVWREAYALSIDGGVTA